MRGCERVREGVIVSELRVCSKREEEKSLFMGVDITMKAVGLVYVQERMNN